MTPSQRKKAQLAFELGAARLLTLAIDMRRTSRGLVSDPRELREALDACNVLFRELGLREQRTPLKRESQAEMRRE